jgi:catechol 2,3-dioxygenase-like lactoylglutathione lyase family enzyme
LTRLRDFYQAVLQIEPRTYGDDYVEFQTGAGVLSLFSLAAQEGLAPGSAQGAANRSVVLEFEVGDVDREYARLQPLRLEWVKPPVNLPWDLRSLYFRDPDGHLVNFYARLKRAAS